MVIVVGSAPDHNLFVFLFDILFLKDQYSTVDNVNLLTTSFTYFPKKYIYAGSSALGKYEISKKDFNITGGVRVFHTISGISISSTTYSNTFDVTVKASVNTTTPISIICEVVSNSY